MTVSARRILASLHTPFKPLRETFFGSSGPNIQDGYANTSTFGCPGCLFQVFGQRTLKFDGEGGPENTARLPQG